MLAALKKHPVITGQLHLFANDFMAVTSQGTESTMYQPSGIFEGDTAKGWRTERGSWWRQKFSDTGHCSDTLIQVIQSSWEFSSSVYTSQPQQTSCSSLWPLGWLSGQTKSTHWIYVCLPHDGISSPSVYHTFAFCPTQPFLVITYSFHCRGTERRGTGTAAYLAGNAAPWRLCSTALTPTEEREDTDFHSCSLIKPFYSEHITQFQKGWTKARLLHEEIQREREENHEKEGKITQRLIKQN